MTPLRLLHTYSVGSQNLPGQGEGGLVLVTLGGTTEEEVEKFAKVFETITAAPKVSDPP